MWGVGIGLIGTALIALGNKLVRTVMGKDAIDKSPASLRRFL
jgi:hypothetical protein